MNAEVDKQHRSPKTTSKWTSTEECCTAWIKLLAMHDLAEIKTSVKPRVCLPPQTKNLIFHPPKCPCSSLPDSVSPCAQINASSPCRRSQGCTEGWSPGFSITSSLPSPKHTHTYTHWAFWVTPHPHPARTDHFHRKKHKDLEMKQKCFGSWKEQKIRINSISEWM